MLRSDLCDYSDPYIVVKGIIIIEGRNNGDIKNTSLPIINDVPFTDCISISICINWQCKKSICCNANVQFNWIQ